MAADYNEGTHSKLNPRLALFQFNVFLRNKNLYTIIFSIKSRGSKTQLMTESTFVNTAKITVRVSYLLTLIITLLVAIQDIQSSQASPWLVLSIMLLPLLLFASSVWTMNSRGLVWLCFVLCLYFTMATVNFLSNSGGTLNALLALSSVTLFSSMGLLIKLRSNHRKAKIKAHTQAEHP